MDINTHGHPYTSNIKTLIEKLPYYPKLTASYTLNCVGTPHHSKIRAFIVSNFHRSRIL